MFNWRKRAKQPHPDQRAEVIMVGDATSMTTGGMGASIEDKRHPYG